MQRVRPDSRAIQISSVASASIAYHDMTPPWVLSWMPMSFFNLGSTVPAVFQAIHLQVRRETYQTGWGSPGAEGSPAN